MQYTPYINWTKSDFYSHMVNLANKLDLSSKIKALVEAALLDERWDPLQQYDGCTLVQDMFHPCLSCFIHDYLWNTGQGGKDADKLFKFLMEAEGLKSDKIWRRWMAVRIYWLFWSKWRHLGKRNVNPYSKEFEAVLTYMKTN